MIQLMNNGTNPMPNPSEANRPQIGSEVDRGAPFVRSFQEFKDLQLGCGEQYVKKVGLGLVCMDWFDAGTSWMQFPFGHLSTLLIPLIKSSHLRGIWFLWQNRFPENAGVWNAQHQE